MVASSARLRPSISAIAGFASVAHPAGPSTRIPIDAPSNSARKRLTASNSPAWLIAAERTTESISIVSRSVSVSRAVSERPITLSAPITREPLNSGTQISDVSPTIACISRLTRGSVAQSSISSGRPPEIACSATEEASGRIAPSTPAADPVAAVVRSMSLPWSRLTIAPSAPVSSWQRSAIRRITVSMSPPAAASARCVSMTCASRSAAPDPLTMPSKGFCDI